MKVLHRQLYSGCRSWAKRVGYKLCHSDEMRCTTF